MIYRALIDVNVFQDVIKKRKSWQESQKVLKLFEGDDYEGWISSLTRREKTLAEGLEEMERR